MSELQKESAPGPKEDKRLSVHLPDGRARAKYSLGGPGCLASDNVDAALQVDRGDVWRLRGHGQDGQFC